VNTPNIVAICGDAGGANAVAPVIELLRGEGRVAVTALAYLQAKSLWAARGLDFSDVEGDLDDREIMALLDRTAAGLLLTGTSVNRYDLEKRFIAAARTLGIPSLSVLDFWSNYALRFSDAAGRLAYLPDRIAAMDEQAREEMIADGIDAARIVVTGHPAFDSLEAYRTGFSPQRREALRQELGVAEDAWLVLFASQPAFLDEEHAEAPPPWLDRQRMLGLLLSALEDLARQYGKEIVLAVRPHPRENDRFFGSIVSRSVRVVLQKGGDARGVAMASDLVVGMATMFLVEAAYLGCPALSIRLGLPLPDTFPPNRSGWVRPVYVEADVRPMVEKLLTGALHASPDRPLPSGDAARQVASLVYGLMRQDAQDSPVMSQLKPVEP
jgi:hypothetical protein